MKSTVAHNFFTFFALTRRNCKIIFKELSEPLVDGIILTGLNVLLFVYLFPAMGMPENLIAPIFLGSLLSMFFNLGFSLAVRIVLDIQYKRFIDYQLTLPLSTSWLLASYICSFFIELFISTAPVLLFGFFALYGKLGLEHAHWPLFMCIYMVSLLFFSILFLAFGFLYEYTWFFDNVWPRRLSLLLLFGCVYVPWYKVYALSPALGTAFLCNPITYVSEGFRSSLLRTPVYIASHLAISVLIFSCILALFVLRYSFNKQFNPVKS